MEDRDLNQDIKVSKFNLDDCCEHQGEKARHYGDLLADAMKAQEEAENRLTMRLGEIWIELKGVQVNGKAPTETDVKSMRDCHPEIVQLRQALSDATWRANTAKSADKAIHGNKDMIETLQRLHAASYFSTPNAGSPGRSTLPAYRPEA